MTDKLIIYSKSGSIIASVRKWEFSDTYMGEQNITFDITSPTQIPWAVGCYCHYRGETYTLNYIPSVTQTARRGESGDAFKYENVKFESAREELTRIIMLDITASTGDYVSSLGTNFTGSSQFTLYCGETVVDSQTRTAVCVLCGKIYANLIRLNTGWRIYVDLTSTHKVNGVDVLNTHTDDKTLTFDNTTVQAALEMIQSEFDIDYCVKGRSVYVGYSLDRLTSDGTESADFFYFGYGRGMASQTEQGKSLYQIKKTSDNNQKIITRLRALGSTKNIPYRYYNKKYLNEQGETISQSMFPYNLQLPGTFLPLGTTSDTGTTTKWGRNNARKDSEGKSYCNAVLGDTNDSYIDKNDNAEGTEEGIREDSARWDGSNSELEEIYPTIKEMTYGELRKALVPDILDVTPTGENDTAAYVNYENTERVDELLSFDDLTNYGDGLLAENQSDQQTQVEEILTAAQQAVRTTTGPDDWNAGTKALKKRIDLFTITDVSAGYYELTPATGKVAFECYLSAGRLSDSEKLTMDVGLRVYITDASGNSLFVDDSGNTVDYYNGETKALSSKDSGSYTSTLLVALPDAKESEDAQISHIHVKTSGSVKVSIAPYYTSLKKNGSSLSEMPEEGSLVWRIGLTDADRKEGEDSSHSQFWWGAEDAATTYMDTPFYLFIKDFGVQNMQACFNTSDDPVIAMTSGYCTGREFKIVSEVPEKVVINGKNCWKVQCSRAEDSSLKTYYPSQRDPVAIGDHYVLLNVSMPDSYIQAAEERLLVAATEYLADNCNTNFTYEPSLDDIYLQREYDKYYALGTPEKSIYWKLYAGLKFPFYGIPDEGQKASDVLVSITIQKVTIKEGEGNTPKVELTLNDDVTQTTIQKLTTAVDRIYNGSIFNTSGGSSVDVSAVRNQIANYGADLFLSRTNADTAKGKIKFNKGIDLGTFATGASGGRLDENGDGELNSLVLRESLTVPKLVYNRTEVVGGNTWRCAGGGEIDTIEETTSTTGHVTLKLEDDEIGMIAVGDICMGIFHLSEGNETTNSDSHNGDFKFSGFTTIYFKITSVSDDLTEFDYELRDGYTVHPQPHMNFAAYGNVGTASGGDDSRQSSELQTREYTLLLTNVSSWNYSSSNIALILGKLSGFTIDVESDDGSTVAYDLQDSGIAFGNAYMWGHIEQLKRVVDTFSMQLSQNAIQVVMSEWYDEDTKDNVSFTFTAKVVTTSGTTVAPTGITLTAPTGITMNETHTLVDNEYHVTVTLVGYFPETVGGIGAKENALGIDIMTNLATVHDSIAIISSYEGDNGKDGQDGEPGTAISVEGSAVAHYSSYVNMMADIENIDDGTVLIDSISVNRGTDLDPVYISVPGSFLCTVTDHEASNVPTSAEEAQPEGTTFVDGDGHLYVAGGESEMWTDCGEIKGADGLDAVSIQTTAETITVKEGDTSIQEVAVTVFSGAEQVQYGFGENGFECSTLADSTIITTGLEWNLRISSDNKTFYYRLKLTDESAVVNIDIPFTVTYNGVSYSKTLSFRTIEKGERGYTGSIARLRGEYSSDATAIYYYNDQYRDIVIKKETTGVYNYYAVKTYGTEKHLSEPNTGSTEWEPANEFSFVATDLLLARLAYFENLGVNNLIVSHKDGSGQTIIDGGFCAADPDNETNIGYIRMWLGGNNPQTAPFRVDRDGNFVASKATLTDADVSGDISAKMMRLGWSTHESATDVINGTAFRVSGQLPDLTADDSVMQLLLFAPQVTRAVFNINVTCSSSAKIYDSDYYSEGTRSLVLSGGIYMFYGFYTDTETKWYYKELYSHNEFYEKISSITMGSTGITSGNVKIGTNNVIIGPSSGAHMEITTSGISIYDSNGTLSRTARFDFIDD